MVSPLSFRVFEGVEVTDSGQKSVKFILFFYFLKNVKNFDNFVSVKNGGNQFLSTLPTQKLTFRNQCSVACTLTAVTETKCLRWLTTSLWCLTV